MSSSRSPASAASAPSPPRRRRTSAGSASTPTRRILGEHVLTSALKKVDVAVFQTIQEAQGGGFNGGEDTIFDVASGGVGIGEIASNVPAEAVAQVKRVQDEIADGTVADIPTTVRASRAAERPLQGLRAASPLLRMTRHATAIIGSPRMDERPVLELRGNHEAVPRHRRERRRRLRPAQGRGARAAGRERRRQVDADERPLRALPAGRGRDPDQRRAGRARLAQGVDRERRRHGAPALHADPGDDGGREHRPRDRAGAQRRPPRLRGRREAGARRSRPASGSPSTRAP